MLYYDLYYKTAAFSRPTGDGTGKYYYNNSYSGTGINFAPKGQTCDVREGREDKRYAIFQGQKSFRTIGEVSIYGYM